MRKVFAIMAVAVMASSVSAQQVIIDFDGNALPDETVLIGSAEVRAEGGDPGGYLKVTDAANGERSTIIFPDLTGDTPVTSLNIKADLRVGGGTDSPADGFSFNLARPDDPVVTAGDGNGFAAAPAGEQNLPEEGTQTGIGVGFDEWFSGDGDVIGLSVRVDNELVSQVELPTKNGALDDITSLQTGPNDDGINNLGWAPFEIDLNSAGQLKVSYKGNLYVDEQLDVEPFAGRLVFAGRTGGANSAHHIDNLLLCVPEPGSSLMVLTGMGILYARLRRREHSRRG